MSQFNKDTIMTVETMEDGRSKRTIRSFVLRQGRLTKGQEQAIDTLWPLYGINYSDSFLNWETIYHNNNPVVLEIGFGMGASLVEMAKMNPHLNYLGIEVHLPGVGACLKSMKEAGVSNLRVINHDAVEVLNHQIPDNSLIGCQIFFPDPWHKAKHNKRRIVQPEFITLLRQKLSIGGIIHLATDWEDYAEQMLEVMNSNENMENLSPNNGFIPRPAERPLTKFEQRGINLGHKVWDLKHKRVL